MESFFSHLEALRRVIIGGLATFLLLLPGMWMLAPRAVGWIQRYGAGEGVLKLKYFALMEPFIVELKLAGFMALAAGMPVFALLLWRFLAPALYRHEKKCLAIAGVAGLGLFGGGAAFALLLVVPMVIKFSLGFATPELEPVIGMNHFVSLILWIMLGFGVMFELPLAVAAAVRTGLVEIGTLRRQRPLIYVVILVVAAILTPPDILSQMLLAIPSVLLFELSLIWCRHFASPPVAAPVSAVAAPPSVREETALGEGDDAMAYERERRREKRRKRRLKY